MTRNVQQINSYQGLSLLSIAEMFRLFPIASFRPYHTCKTKCFQSRIPHSDEEGTELCDWIIYHYHEVISTTAGTIHISADTITISAGTITISADTIHISADTKRR